MPSRDTQLALRLAEELRRDPMWSLDQAAWVESMQCRRVPDLVEWCRPAPAPAPPQIIHRSPCPVCGTVAELDGRSQCSSCDYDDRRDRAGM